jgi:hypothetical protein
MQRLNRLERENRRWKVSFYIVMPVLGLVILLGATHTTVTDEVRARQFVLMDESGMDRGTFGMMSSGGATLRLSGKPNPDGSPKGGAAIEAREDGSVALVLAGGVEGGDLSA